MRVVFTCFLLAFPFFSLKAQQSIVATVDDEAISAQELLYAFNKNRSKAQSIAYDSLYNYLQQYINFKLKVRAARNAGLDTATAFQEELKGYIAQVRKPYLDNPEAEEALLKETYRRMQTEINAAHILLKLSPTASPADTLKAYTFLDSLRNTIGSAAEFQEMARRFSEDGSAPTGGQLGWFGAMHMVAPFEDAAYSTEKGKVSNVVRSNFGYHLVYVNDKRPNRGRVKTSHLFFSKQRGSEAAKSRAESIYDSLKNGADWNVMARKYSDDQGTKFEGGKLPWAGSRQLPDDYLNIAFELNTPGEWTTPQETQFGWHIVRLDDKQPLEPYEVKKGEISVLLKRMGRSVLEEDKLLKKLKKESNFTQSKDSLEIIFNQISGLDKEQILSTEVANKLLFTHGGRPATVARFVDQLPGFNVRYTKDQLIESYFRFEKNFIIAHEDSIAPTKYPEYGFLLKEYEEGLLLFEIMQQKVWNKAVGDSLGLEAYYQKHKKKYNIDERVQCLIISNYEASALQHILSKKVPEEALKNPEEFLSQLTESETEALKFAKRNLLVSELSNFDPAKNQPGDWLISEQNNACLYLKLLPAGPQPLNEIKGLVMSDYQEQLDKEWVKKLRQNAKVKINKQALKALVKH